jgi:hypothetical protein
MITLDDLKRLRYYDASIASAEERLADIRMKAEGLSRSLNGMPRSSTHKDKMIEYMIRLEETQYEIGKQITEMVELENRVREEVSRLPYQQAMIMNYRYLTFKNGHRLSWYDVARRSHYSVQHCKTIHQVAMRNLTGEKHELDSK